MSNDRLTAAFVTYLIDAIEDESVRSIDSGDIVWLAPPGLRAGVHIDDLELPEVRNAPLGQRVVAYYVVMRSQARRNGIDGFVWNAFDHLGAMLADFASIGANDAIAALVELASHVADDDEDARGHDGASADAVAQFATFRDRAGGPWSASADPVADVWQALRRFAREHPESFEDRDGDA